MNRIGAFFAAAVFLGVAVVAKAPPQGGWVSLFKGKDLTGWKKNGEEKWVVERGTIRCESAANKYGYLTRREPARGPTAAGPGRKGRRAETNWLLRQSNIW